MDKPTPDQDRPSIFDALDEAAEARADADLAAGRMVSHDHVRAWLLKLAAGRYEPPPEPDGCGTAAQLW